MYRTTTVLINVENSQFTVQKAEKIGDNLVIHRGIGRDRDGNIVANGKTWTVTLHPFGASLVSGIATRAEARFVANSLRTAVADFRAAVEEAQQDVRSEQSPALA